MNQFDTNSERIAKYLAGEITPDEERELFAWVEADAANKKFFDETVEIWNMTEGVAAGPFEADMDQAWANIAANIEKTATNDTPTQGNTGYRSAKIIPSSKRIWRWSVAAAILLALGTWLFWPGHPPAQAESIAVRTFDKERKMIVLPDSSRVWLNENSTLAYRPDFSQRRVELEGEAFFEVERLEERPFQIFSGDAVTTVLGTSFNVRAYPGEDKIEVTVKTGKVALAVTQKDAPTVTLAAGETGIFDKKEERVSLADATIANADAWKTARLDFHEARVKDVIMALERYFDTEIEVSDPMIFNCRYSANFDAPVLMEALENLAFGLGLGIEKTPGGFLLSGRGCRPAN